MLVKKVFIAIIKDSKNKENRVSLETMSERVKPTRSREQGVFEYKTSWIKGSVNSIAREEGVGSWPSVME